MAGKQFAADGNVKQIVSV